MATLRNHRNFWLRDDAAAAFDKAEADHGIFTVNSAGRYEWEQQGLINKWNQGGTYNRPPYLYKPAMPAKTSNHVRNGGVAVDIGDWRRFAKICRDYGFVHSYPDSDPVHFDFVGGGNSGGSYEFNQDVKNRQEWLISRGYDLGSYGADGLAGPKYTAAVQSYQTFLKSFGYAGDIDGVWGDGTQKAHQKFYDQVHSSDATLKSQQQFLISRGYDLGTYGADGVWGPKTEAAIKAYQTFLRKYGYTGEADGIWGDGTQAAHSKFYAELNGSSTSTPAFPLPNHQWFGPEAGGDNSISGWYSHNADLRVFQQRMADRGWPITVDGLYGPKGATTPTGNTAEVVVAFQKEKGLTADGLIGPTTWKAAWESPVTPAQPTPEKPKPTEPTPDVPLPDDEIKATPDLITPTAKDFPSWIKFDIVTDPESQKPNLNVEAAEYYGVPYLPIESHWHWWNSPGKGGSHSGNVSHIKNTKDLSVNFVLSENWITLMVPLNKIALTTGTRNPYAWKVENDPTLSEQQYKTMGYLLYIVEKLNPSLLNDPLRLHKEFYATSCSDINKSKVRQFAEDFRTGALDPTTGNAPESPVEPTEPTEPNTDYVQIPREFVTGLPGEFRQLASDLEQYL